MYFFVHMFIFPFFDLKLLHFFDHRSQYWSVWHPAPCSGDPKTTKVETKDAIFSQGHGLNILAVPGATQTQTQMVENTQFYIRIMGENAALFRKFIKEIRNWKLG